MFVTDVKTVGFVLMSIVPAVKDQVDVVLSVNCASESEPAPIVRSDSAASDATIPRRRLRRRSTCVSTTWGSTIVRSPFPDVDARTDVRPRRASSPA